MKRLLFIFILAFFSLVFLSRWPQLIGLETKPHLLVILVIHLGIFFPDWRGGLAVFLLGYLADLFSGYLMGLNMLIFTLDFALVAALAHLISFRFVWVRAAVVALAVFLNRLLCHLVLGMFHAPEELDAFWWKQALWELALTSLLAPVLLNLLDLLEKKWSASEA